MLFPMERMHEVESEFPEGLHETVSDFTRRTGLPLHESKSEYRKPLHEITSECTEKG